MVMSISKPMQTPPTPRKPILFAGADKVLEGEKADKFRKLLPNVTLTDPVAALDLGGNGFKGLFYIPDKNIVEVTIPVINGSSIGKTGKIDAKAESVLIKAAKKMQRVLLKYKIQMQNVIGVATAGLRDASNGLKMAEKIRQLGIPMEIIPGIREGGLVYLSALADRPDIGADEQVVVFEIGGGSTGVVPGKGKRHINTELVKVLPLGTGRFNLKEPLNTQEMARKRLEIRKSIKDTLTQDVVQACKDKRAFIKPRNFRDIAPLLKTAFGIDFLKEPLSHQQLESLLDDPNSNGPELLRNDYEGKLAALYAKASAKAVKNVKRPESKKPRVQKAYQKELDKKRKAYFKSYQKELDLETKKLVGKLLVLDELMAHLEVESLSFGFCGGLKFSVLEGALLQGKGGAKTK